MKRAVVAFSLMIAAGTAGYWLLSRGKVAAAEPAGADSIRKSVELTVYAEDFGMAREVRPFTLAPGANKLQVPEVSRQLDAQSVLLKWQGPAANQPELVSHSYDLGVSGGDDLLKRYLGKEVEVVRYGDNGHESERQKGRLMVGGGGVVLQTDGKFYVHPPGSIVAPVSKEVVTIPQLSVQAVSPFSQPASLEVAYLTRGLSWSADYVATMSPRDDSMRLECWATVTNRTGVDYPSAKVSLIAGTPNRAVMRTARSRLPYDFAGEMAGRFTDGHSKFASSTVAATPPANVAPPETVGDFYSYPIKNPTTVQQEQMNRLLLLSSDKVSVIKDYSSTAPTLMGWDEYYGSDPSRQPIRGHVQVAMSYFNREKDGLGTPLPHGAIRVYEEDKSGSLRYSGAATIVDTPKEQKINVTLSNAFDLFTEWRVVKKRKIDKRTIQKEVEVVLHNERSAPVKLRIVQPIYGRWSVVSESHKHVNLNSATPQWTVEVPAGGKTILSFTANLSG